MPAAMKRPATRCQQDEQPVLKRPAAATVPADDKAADPMAPLPENKEELEKFLADPKYQAIGQKACQVQSGREARRRCVSHVCQDETIVRSQ